MCNISTFLLKLEFDICKTCLEIEVQAAAPNRKGPSKGIPEWNTGVKVEVMFDSTFQPVGARAAQLKSQLGKIVRDGHRIPLTIIDWKSVGDDVKERIWTEVKVYLLFIFVGKKFKIMVFVIFWLRMVRIKVLHGINTIFHFHCIFHLHQCAYGCDIFENLRNVHILVSFSKHPNLLMFRRKIC